MLTILSTMLRGLFRDGHTLVWNIAFPIAMLMGLGLYFNDEAYSYRLLSGVLTTNILFGATMVTAFNVLAQRNRGIYKLLRATPFRTSSFIAAMTGSRTVLALLVSVCVIVMSLAMLKVRLSPLSLIQMLIVLIVGTVCFTALGFLAANLSKDENSVNLISNLMSFPMLFTSEAFYSLDGAPQWVVIVGHLQPFHYLVEAMGFAAQPPADASFSGIWLPLAILAGFTVLCLGAAILTFRWDADQPPFWKRRKAATGVADSG